MTQSFDPRLPPPERNRAARRRRRRLFGGAASLSVHALAFLAIFLTYRAAPTPLDPPAMQASLVTLPKPDPPAPAPPKPAPPEPPKAIKAKAGGQHSAVRPTPIRAPAPMVLAAAIKPTPDTSDLLTQSELAGAAAAGDGGGGDGGGGGSCDIAAAVQRALRRDPLVSNALFNAGRSGQAIKVWNGGWVRSGSEDGKGLAVIREAILWEVGFSPKACREEPVHGLVLLSLAGGTRIAVGAGEWRWQDVLALR